MKLWVFDATPLIYLSKAKILEKIGPLPTKKIILRSVYEEVVKEGVQRGHSDAFYVEKLIQEKVFAIEENERQSATFLSHKNVSVADRDVLSFAQNRKAIIIADDEEIRRIAEIENMEHHGSVYVLFTLLHRKVLKREELKKAINIMINEGWYCSVDVYNLIMEKLGKE